MACITGIHTSHEHNIAGWTHMLVPSGGDMRARDVITTGYLEVGGRLATGTLIGDYNDCTARIGGDVHARVFYGADHYFTIGGRLTVDAVLMLDPHITDVAVRPR